MQQSDEGAWTVEKQNVKKHFEKICAHLLPSYNNITASMVPFFLISATSRNSVMILGVSVPKDKWK